MKTPKKEDARPPHSALLVSVLTDMGGGAVVGRMSSKLEALIELCKTRRASGSLSIDLKVSIVLDEKNNPCEVVFEATEKVKEPREVFRPLRSSWFVDKDGTLTKEDPSGQLGFTIINDQADKEQARPVSPSAPVIRVGTGTQG